MRFLLILALAFALGCGTRAPTDPKDYGDAERIGLLLTDFEDARTNPDRLAGLFAKGAPLPDASRLRQIVPQVKKAPKVEGDSATVLVAFTSDADGSSAGESSWTFAKEEGKWKIKDAPLP